MFDPEQQQVSLDSGEIETHQRHKKMTVKTMSHPSDYKSPTPDLGELLKLINPFREEPATPDLTAHTRKLFLYIAFFGLLQTLYANIRVKYTVERNRLTDVNVMSMYFGGLVFLLVLTIQLRGILAKTNEWIVVLAFYLIHAYLTYFFLFGFSYVHYSIYRRLSHINGTDFMEYRIAGLGLFLSTSSAVGYALMMFFGLVAKFVSPKRFFMLNALLNFFINLVWVYPRAWEKNTSHMNLLNVASSLGVALIMMIQVKYVNVKLRSGNDYNLAECIYLALVGRFRALMSIVVLILRGILDLFCAIFYY